MYFIIIIISNGLKIALGKVFFKYIYTEERSCQLKSPQQLFFAIWLDCFSLFNKKVYLSFY